MRDLQKRGRYATCADRSISGRIVRDIKSMTPSARLILLTLRVDRQVTASSANASTKHFRYRKSFFNKQVCHKRAFSQRARAYTLNPTLPYPTLPYPTLPYPTSLPPRALLDNPSSGQALPLNFGLQPGPLRKSFFIDQHWLFRATLCDSGRR